MVNDYASIKPERVALLALHIRNVVEEPDVWGLTPAQLQRLESAALGLQAGIEEANQAKARAAAMVIARNERESECKAAIASVARAVYANMDLETEQIRNLGLAPRKTTRTPVVPQTPSGLNACIGPNGEVVLKWHREGNAPTVIFRIEARVGNGPWTSVTEATACRVVLRGYRPGETTIFRIVAVKSGREAPPSNMAWIYPPESGSARKLESRSDL